MRIRSIMVFSIVLLLITTLLIPPMILDNLGKEVSSTDFEVQPIFSDTRRFADFVRSDDYFYNLLVQRNESFGLSLTLRKSEKTMAKVWEMPLNTSQNAVNWKIVAANKDYVVVVASDFYKSIPLDGFSEQSALTFNMTANWLVFSADVGQLLFNSTYTLIMPIYYDAFLQEFWWVFYEGIIVEDTIFIPLFISSNVEGVYIDPDLEKNNFIKLMQINMKTGEVRIDELMELSQEFIRTPSKFEMAYSYSNQGRLLDISFLLSYDEVADIQ